jgi:hypothetical protein
MMPRTTRATFRLDRTAYRLLELGEGTPPSALSPLLRRPRLIGIVVWKSSADRQGLAYPL